MSAVVVASIQPVLDGVFVAMLTTLFKMIAAHVSEHLMSKVFKGKTGGVSSAAQKVSNCHNGSIQSAGTKLEISRQAPVLQNVVWYLKGVILNVTIGNTISKPTLELMKQLFK